MSLTHHQGQELEDCPECGRTIRLVPPRFWLNDIKTIHCGRCGNWFETTKSDHPKKA